VNSRFHLSSRSLLVAFFTLAWTGFVLWLTVPWIDDMGITFPGALALIVVLGILPGVLYVRLLSALVFDDESEPRPGHHA
jgi:hypothetical protein